MCRGYVTHRLEDDYTQSGDDGTYMECKTNNFIQQYNNNGTKPSTLKAALNIVMYIQNVHYNKIFNIFVINNNVF